MYSCAYSLESSSIGCAPVTTQTEPNIHMGGFYWRSAAITAPDKSLIGGMNRYILGINIVQYSCRAPATG